MTYQQALAEISYGVAFNPSSSYATADDQYRFNGLVDTTWKEGKLKESFGR